MTEVDSVGKRFFEAQDRLRGGPDEALCAVDYTADLNGQHLDLEGHKQFASAFYAAFPDLHHEFDSIDFAESAERVRCRLIGTHEGEFMGLPATGKSIEVSIDAIFTLRDGKVESITGAFDQTGMMQQLGVG